MNQTPRVVLEDLYDVKIVLRYPDHPESVWAGQDLDAQFCRKAINGDAASVAQLKEELYLIFKGAIRYANSKAKT